jgi:hypothetical protein
MELLCPDFQLERQKMSRFQFSSPAATMMTNAVPQPMPGRQGGKMLYCNHAFSSIRHGLRPVRDGQRDASFR